MKTLLLSVLFTITFLQIKAQCQQTANSFGNNTSTASYNISGDVVITLNENNTVTLSLASNFSTAEGPDVRAYLVNSEGKTTEELKNATISNLDSVEFGIINASGSQDHIATIPEGKDITKYDTVFFYCFQFNQFWDLGKFTSFNSTNCSVLSSKTLKIDTISMYPNPAKNEIHISNIDAVSTEIRIFNVLGKQVFYQPKLTEKTINISSYNKGIYIVKLNVDGKTKTQKLVIN
jgi:hypothetical protein